MAGFANIFIPLAQSLGVAKQKSDVMESIRTKREASERGVDEILGGLGPEYEIFRRARKQGMTTADVAAMIGGPIGQEIHTKHASARMAELMAGPGDIRERLTKGAAEGLIPWNDALKLMQTGRGAEAEAQSYLTFAASVSDPRKKAALMRASTMASNGVPDAAIQHMLKITNLFSDPEIEAQRRARTRYVTMINNALETVMKGGKLPPGMESLLGATGTSMTPSPEPAEPVPTAPDEDWVR